jgi:hypothetical protein
MLELSPFHALTAEDTGLLAYIGRMLRARDARVHISTHGLLIETRDAMHAAELRRMLDTHNRESSDSMSLVLSKADDSERLFYVSRVLA